MSERRQLGRVESGLERDLMARKDMGAAERTALRAQAHAVDMAEANADPDAITRANVGYLQLREAAGLSVNGSKPVDAFDNLMAEIGRSTPGAIDAADT